MGGRPGTLPEMLREAADTFRWSFHDGGDVTTFDRDALQAEAAGAAAALDARGIGPGDAVGILGPNHPRWLISAMGVWVLGGVVVPIAYPLRVRRPEVVRAHVEALVRTARCRAVAVDPDLGRLVDDGLAFDWTTSSDGEAPSPAIAPEDPAAIQFTSGSTSAPRGARLSHRAILGALESLRLASQRTTEDRMATWQPLFHDMGLYGFPLRGLFEGFAVELMPTLDFARDPLAWLRLIEGTRATVMAAPASALAATIRAAQQGGTSHDLSSIGHAVLGGETVDPRLVDRFQEWSPSVGLRPKVLGVCLGMAEATVGVTMTRLGEGVRVVEVDLAGLAEGEARPASGGPSKRIVSVGPPLPGIEIRIGDPHAPFADDRAGEVLVRSPGAMDGYVGTDQHPFVDGWLQTGDVGFIRDGEVFLTGRSKDLVIVMGRNYAPEDFEWATGAVPGVRAGRCVAFSPADQEGTLIVVLELRPGADEDEVRTLVRRAVADATGLTPKRILVVPPDTIPKTTSGKLQRGAVRDAYDRGELPGA
jgi:acyl-CoA synthetase (AMP-forming)/AMP-acid ligase II